MHICNNSHQQIKLSTQLHQETWLYKKIEAIDPAMHVPLTKQASEKQQPRTELTKVIHQGWPELKHNILLSSQAGRILGVCEKPGAIPT